MWDVTSYFLVVHALCCAHMFSVDLDLGVWLNILRRPVARSTVFIQGANVQVLGFGNCWFGTAAIGTIADC